MNIPREAKLFLASVAGGFLLNAYVKMSPYYIALMLVGFAGTLSFEKPRVYLYNFFPFVSPYSVENGHLSFKNNENMRASDLETTCRAALINGSKNVSLSLTYSGWYGVRFNHNLGNFAEIVAKMVADPACQIQSLNLSSSNLSVEEFKKIYDAIPSNTKLINIDISDNQIKPDEIELIKEYIQKGNKNIDIQGLQDQPNANIRGSTYH